MDHVSLKHQAYTQNMWVHDDTPCPEKVTGLACKDEQVMKAEKRVLFLLHLSFRKDKQRSTKSYLY